MTQIRPETEYLLELLRCVQGDDRPRPLPEAVDLQKLLRLAKRHDVFLLAVQVLLDSGTISEADLGAWSDYRAKNLVKSFNQMDNLELLRSAFSAEKIDYLLLKGAHIRPLYPHPELREMADLDILVRPESMAAAAALLTANGFILQEKGPIHDSYFKPPYTSVELHRGLMSSDHEVSRYFTDPWKRAVATGNGTEYRFSPEDEYIFLIGHAAKHYYYYGTGIRSVFDLFLVRSAYSSLSAHRDYLRRELKKAGIAEFARNISELASVWFGDSGQPLSDGASEMRDLILSGATYGVAGSHTKLAVKQMMERGHSERHAKLRYFLRILFPDSYSMSVLYPVLKKAPFLLPFCWVARGLRTLFKKPKAIVREFTKVRDTSVS